MRILLSGTTGQNLVLYQFVYQLIIQQQKWKVHMLRFIRYYSYDQFSLAVRA